MNAGRTGKLDALAKCTLLETLDLSGCNGYDEDVNKVSEGLTGTWHRSLTAETITNLNPLTPLPILRLFRTAGTLDALASCTSLTSVDVSGTKVEGQSARALGLVALNLHCKPPRPSLI